MTDTITEGGHPGEEVGSQSTTLPGSGDKQLSDRVEALEKVNKELLSQVRALQSGKDKGVARVSNEMKDFKDVFKQWEKMVAKGLGPDEIEREIEIDALLAERRGPKTPPDVPPAGGDGTPAQQKAGAKTIETLLEQLGFSPTSPEGIAVLRNTDIESQLVELSQLAKKKRESAERPANAAQLMGSGGGSTPPDELATVTTRVEEALKAPSKIPMKELNELIKQQEALVKKNQ